MSGIEELRQRVQDAEQHFGLAREEQVKYSERLIGLIDEVEGRLRAQQAEIDGQQAAVAGQNEALAKEQAQIHRLECDNEHLREMLHSLLKAIETGGRNGLVEIMQTLDQKVSALITADAAPTEIAAAPEPVAEAAPEPEPTPEPVAETVAEPVAEAVPETEMEAVPEPVVEPEAEPVAEAMAEPELETAPEPVVEPELETAPEPVAEPEEEPVAEAAPEPEMEAAPEPAAESAAADGNSTAAALEEIASQLAMPSTDSSEAVPDSLHEIMDRVSKLVREAEPEEIGVAQPKADPSSEKKSAAG